MDAIARVSGVSKATIYKHWADKEALLMEVMLLVHGLDGEPEDVDSGDLERDIAIVLSRKPPGEFEEARMRMMPTLIAYSAVHPEFGSAWRHNVMEPPRQCLRRILERGVQRGVLRRDLDIEVAIALLLGPTLYWHIFVNGKKPGREGKELARKRLRPSTALLPIGSGPTEVARAAAHPMFPLRRPGRRSRIKNLQAVLRDWPA